MMSTGATHELLEVGVISPEPIAGEGLGVGEVGYLITGVKDVRQSRVGDTVTNAGQAAPPRRSAATRDPKPMVFSGLYPIDGCDYPELREALDKLQLNDAALRLRAGDVGARSASASAAASSACCTWRSSASASSASSAST